MAELVTDEIVIRAYWPLPKLGGRRISYGIPLTLVGIVVAGLAIGHLITITRPPGRSEIAIAMLAVLSPLLSVVGAFYYDGTELFANREHVILKKWFRQPTVIPVAEVGRIVQLTVDVPVKYGTDSRPAVFFFNRDGRCIVSLYSTRFHEDDLALLWTTIGMQPEGSVLDHCLQSRLDDRFPGAFDKQKAA